MRRTIGALAALAFAIPPAAAAAPEENKEFIGSFAGIWSDGVVTLPAVVTVRFIREDGVVFAQCSYGASSDGKYVPGTAQASGRIYRKVLKLKHGFGSSVFVMRTDGKLFGYYSGPDGVSTGLFSK